MSGYVVMYREAVKGNDEWSPWLRLSEKVHETIEDSNKELEEEIQDDEEWGTGDFSYIYRTMTEKEAENTTSTDYGHVSPEDMPVVRSEAGAGPVSVAVPVERLKALEGIEARLEAEWADLQSQRERIADKIVRGMVDDAKPEVLKVSEDWLSELTGRQKLLNKIMGKD